MKKDKTFKMLTTEEIEIGEGKAKYIQVLGKGKIYNTANGKISIAVADKLIEDKKAKEGKTDGS